MTPAAQSSPAEQLQQLLEGYRTFSADFDQVTQAGDGQRPQASTGKLVLRKPNLFRWTTDEPYPQVIVNDGTYLWIYDPDLMQVTRKPFDRQGNNAPALILNGQIDRLGEDFQIKLLSKDKDGMLFELLPRSSQSTFSRIRLYFQHGLISQLMLEDSLGQRTTIQFHHQKLNPTLADDLFRFKVPADADVVVDPGA